MGRDTGQMFAEISGYVTAWAVPAGLAQVVAESFGSSITPPESRIGSPQACALCPWCGHPLLGQSLWQGIVSAD